VALIKRRKVVNNILWILGPLLKTLARIISRPNDDESLTLVDFLKVIIAIFLIFISGYFYLKYK
jgi:hypothetical protein